MLESEPIMNFEDYLKRSYERLFLIDEKLKKIKRMRNVWKGYRKKHKKKATRERDIFSQTINQRAELKSLNPFNAKRLQD